MLHYKTYICLFAILPILQKWSSI